MPRKYKRKEGVQPRVIAWTEDTLTAALKLLQNKQYSVCKVAKIYGIPSRTLHRRYTTQNKKKNALGKPPTLGIENEGRLVTHIQKLEQSGLVLESITARSLAFQFAEKFHINHNFNTKTKLAGPAWLQTFTKRNPVLSIGDNKNADDTQSFYKLLKNVLEEDDLLDKPDRIYNMGEVTVEVQTKETSNFRELFLSNTSNRIGETVTVVAYSNALGSILPPLLIIRGGNQIDDFIDDLPTGSRVIMNKQTVSINSELFIKCLKEHFIPMKPHGKVLLILDSHISHLSAFDMYEITEKHDIRILFLPGHETSTLQPLNKAVFEPFKTYLTAECNHDLPGEAIGQAWFQATTPANIMSEFRNCGIYPDGLFSNDTLETVVKIENIVDT